jgi:hypothetical protein
MPAFFMRRSFLCAGLFYAPAFIMRWSFLCADLYYALVFFMRQPVFMRIVMRKGGVFHLLSVCIGALDILVLSTIL